MLGGDRLPVRKAALLRGRVGSRTPPAQPDRVDARLRRFRASRLRALPAPQEGSARRGELRRCGHPVARSDIQRHARLGVQARLTQPWWHRSADRRTTPEWPGGFRHGPTCASCANMSPPRGAGTTATSTESFGARCAEPATDSCPMSTPGYGWVRCRVAGPGRASCLGGNGWWSIAPGAHGASRGCHRSPSGSRTRGRDGFWRPH